MIRNTVCRKCKTVNTPDAVVCTACGAKLKHPERGFLHRFREAGILRNIVRVPWRLIHYLYVKTVMVASILLFCVVFGGISGALALFFPLSWPDYPKPAELTAEDKEKIQNSKELGGNCEFLRNYGQSLICSGLKEEDAGKPLPGYFSVMPDGQDHLNMVIYTRVRGKIPFRILLKLESDRGQNGIVRITSCKIGNLSVPSGTAFKLAKRMLTQWNEKQKFTDKLLQVKEMRQDLRAGDSKNPIYQIQWK